MSSDPAVIIGAMVIAPLLGPNIALALATCLGNSKLALASLRTQAIGLILALVVSMGIPAWQWETFFRITLPVIAPGVISGALFAFATSFDEVVVTLFLAGADQSTLPRQMFNGIRENISPTIAAVATLLILFTTSLLLALCLQVLQTRAPILTR